MKVLAVGASLRELRWWRDINNLLGNFHIDYLNCSSRIFNNCHNLRNYSRDSKNFSPSINEKYNIPISHLIHEHNLYPGYSFRKLVKKYEIHLKAYEKFFNQNKFKLIILENGGFIFINSLLTFAQKHKIPVVFLEGSDEANKFFAFINSKGPDLQYAIPNENKGDYIDLSKQDVLTQNKDKDVDKRFINSIFIQLYKLFKYTNRRMDSEFISIDGSFRVIFKLKMEYTLKKFLISLHYFKSKLFQSNDHKKNIIFPTHLERDLHLTERTNFHSQIKFLLGLPKIHNKKQIFFKLHPHSITLGPSLIDHIKLLFSPLIITDKKPEDLDIDNDEVHTLGSKYGLQAARNRIATYIYGDTFFFKNKFKDQNIFNFKKRLFVIDNEKEKYYSKYKHKIYLYEQTKLSLEESALGIYKIISSLLNKTN